MSMSNLPLHLRAGQTSLRGHQHVRDEVERQQAFTSIEKSMGPRRTPLDLSQIESSLTEVTEAKNEDGDEPDMVVETVIGPPTPAMTSTRSSSPILHMPTIDFDGLSWPSIGTKTRKESTPEQEAARIKKISDAMRSILETIGEDPEREGIHGTPERYAKAMMFFTQGYEQNLKDIVNGAIFEEDHDELVIVKDIEIFTLCEHHLVPFTGKMHIGYIPNSRVIGLSKIARIAEMFARRLQVQERLTKQVALAISEILKPQGVAVVMESSHLCMVMRGVQKPGATTTTSCMLGRMRSTAKTREEFLTLLNRR